MIEHQTIGGREATIAYLTAGMEPSPKDGAAMAKVLFDGGDMLLLNLGAVPSADDYKPAALTASDFDYAEG